MKKKSDEELGILLTREMQSMMFNEKLTCEQRVAIFCAVVSGEDVDDPLLSAFAETLKTGFNHANDARKASIYNRRQRQLKYLRTSTEIDEDERASKNKNAHRHSSPIKGKGKGNGICIIPLPPKGGKGAKVPSAISTDDLTKEARPFDDRTWAAEIAGEIVGWYPYEVNQEALKKILIAKSKKNLRRALEDGMAAWLASGAWDEQRFVPPDIVKWIKLERFLDKPPQKKSSAARSECGRASAAPSADATLRMIQCGEDE